MSASKVLCILNGGHISTASTAIACQQFDEVHAITFKDEKQNQIDLDSSISVADVLGLASHEVVDLSPFFAKTPITASNYRLNRSKLDLTASESLDNKETDFTSAKSILFLTVAANKAAERGIKDILIEICKEDLVNAYERHQDFLASITRVLGEGVWRDPNAIKIHTPFIHLTKTQILSLAFAGLSRSFSNVFELTNDCKAGVEGGCGQCQPCLSRDLNFQKAGIEDPIWRFRHPEFRNPKLRSIV